MKHIPGLPYAPLRLWWIFGKGGHTWVSVPRPTFGSQTTGRRNQVATPPSSDFF